MEVEKLLVNARQNHSFVSNKYIFQALYQTMRNVQTTKRNCEKLLGWQNVLRNHYIAILFNPVLQVCPSVPLLVFNALSMLPFQCFKKLFLCFTPFAGSSRRLNFDKFRNTAPLIRYIFTCRSSLFKVLFSTLLSSNRASSQSVLKELKVWFMLCLLLMTSIGALLTCLINNWWSRAVLIKGNQRKQI